MASDMHYHHHIGERQQRGTDDMSEAADRRFAPPGDEEAATLDLGIDLINCFREVDPKMPSSYMAMFMAVAREPGMGPTHYAQRIGTIQPIASRILLEIGIKARERQQPLGLVDRTSGSEDLRSQAYYLTTKGRLLERKIHAAVKRHAKARGRTTEN